MYEVEYLEEYAEIVLPSLAKANKSNDTSGDIADARRASSNFTISKQNTTVQNDSDSSSLEDLMDFFEDQSAQHISGEKRQSNSRQRLDSLDLLVDDIDGDDTYLDTAPSTSTASRSPYAKEQQHSNSNVRPNIKEKPIINKFLDDRRNKNDRGHQHNAASVATVRPLLHQKPFGRPPISVSSQMSNVKTSTPQQNWLSGGRTSDGPNSSGGSGSKRASEFKGPRSSASAGYVYTPYPKGVNRSNPTIIKPEKPSTNSSEPMDDPLKLDTPIKRGSAKKYTQVSPLQRSSLQHKEKKDSSIKKSVTFADMRRTPPPRRRSKNFLDFSPTRRDSWTSEDSLSIDGSDLFESTDPTDVFSESDNNLQERQFGVDKKNFSLKSNQSNTKKMRKQNDSLSIRTTVPSNSCSQERSMSVSTKKGDISNDSFSPLKSFESSITSGSSVSSQKKIKSALLQKPHNDSNKATEFSAEYANDTKIIERQPSESKPIEVKSTNKTISMNNISDARKKPPENGENHSKLLSKISIENDKKTSKVESPNIAADKAVLSTDGTKAEEEQKSEMKTQKTVINSIATNDIAAANNKKKYTLPAQIIVKKQPKLLTLMADKEETKSSTSFSQKLPVIADKVKSKSSSSSLQKLAVMADKEEMKSSSSVAQQRPATADKEETKSSSTVLQKRPATADNEKKKKASPVSQKLPVMTDKEKSKSSSSVSEKLPVMTNQEEKKKPSPVSQKLPVMADRDDKNKPSPVSKKRSIVAEKDETKSSSPVSQKLPVIADRDDKKKPSLVSQKRSVMADKDETKSSSSVSQKRQSERSGPSQIVQKIMDNNEDLKRLKLDEMKPRSKSISAPNSFDVLKESGSAIKITTPTEESKSKKTNRDSSLKVLKNTASSNKSDQSTLDKKLATVQCPVVPVELKSLTSGSIASVSSPIIPAKDGGFKVPLTLAEFMSTPNPMDSPSPPKQKKSKVVIKKVIAAEKDQQLTLPTISKESISESNVTTLKVRNDILKKDDSTRKTAVPIAMSKATESETVKTPNRKRGSDANAVKNNVINSEVKIKRIKMSPDVQEQESTVKQRRRTKILADLHQGRSIRYRSASSLEKNLLLNQCREFRIRLNRSTVRKYLKEHAMERPTFVAPKTKAKATLPVLRRQNSSSESKETPSPAVPKTNSVNISTDVSIACQEIKEKQIAQLADAIESIPKSVIEKKANTPNNHNTVEKKLASNMSNSDRIAVHEKRQSVSENSKANVASRPEQAKERQQSSSVPSSSVEQTSRKQIVGNRGKKLLTVNSIPLQPETSTLKLTAGKSVIDGPKVISSRTTTAATAQPVITKTKLPTNTNTSSTAATGIPVGAVTGTTMMANSALRLPSSVIVTGSTYNLPPLPIDSNGTHLYSFLHPASYNERHGRVMLDYCCPNLDQPMPAIDPTRLHSRIDTPVRELPSYIVMSTKLITRSELHANKNSIPASIRKKVDKIATTTCTTTTTTATNIPTSIPKTIPTSIASTSMTAQNSSKNQSPRSPASVVPKMLTSVADDTQSVLRRFDSLCRRYTQLSGTCSYEQRLRVFQGLLNDGWLTIKKFNAASQLLSDCIQHCQMLSGPQSNDCKETSDQQVSKEKSPPEVRCRPDQLSATQLLVLKTAGTTSKTANKCTSQTSTAVYKSTLITNENAGSVTVYTKNVVPTGNSDNTENGMEESILPDFTGISTIKEEETEEVDFLGAN